MKQVSVLLDSVEKIRSFVDIIEKSEADADLSQLNHYLVRYLLCLILQPD